MKPDGGPAFPYDLARWKDGVEGGEVIRETNNGMSLRDYAAIKFISARLTLKDERTRDEIIEDGFADADAMLAEREKP